MEAANKIGAVAQLVQNSLAYTGHDCHADNNVDGVGNFDTGLCKVGLNGTHGERNDIHSSALHGAGEDLLSHLVCLLGLHPVVGGTAVFLFSGTNECSAFNTSNVVQSRTMIITSGELFLVELDHFAGCACFGIESIQLLLASVNPKHFIGACDFDCFVNELKDSFVGC